VPSRSVAGVGAPVHRCRLLTGKGPSIKEAVIIQALVPIIAAIAFVALVSLGMAASDRKRWVSRRQLREDWVASGEGSVCRTVDINLGASEAERCAENALRSRGVDRVYRVNNALLGFTRFTLLAFYFRKWEPMQYSVQIVDSTQGVTRYSCCCGFRFGFPMRLPRNSPAQMQRRLDELIRELMTASGTT
jgi:hypothetical protein